MKKSTIVIALCFFSMLPLVAQDLATSLTVNAGPIVPFNELGSKRLTSTSGFANTGRSIGLGFNAELAKHFSLNVSFFNSSFSINREKFDEYTTRTIQRDVEASGGVVTDQFTLTSSLRNYSNNNISLGFRFDFDLNEKAAAFVQPALSYDFFKIPELSIVITDSSFQVGSSQLEATSAEIGYNLSAGFVYTINEDVALSFSGTLFNARHEPLIEGRAVNQNGDSVELEQREQINYSALAFLIGIEIRLNRKSASK